MNREGSGQLSVISYRFSVLKLFTVYCSLFTVFTGCASLTPPAERISAEQNICPDSPIRASLQKRSEELKTLKGTALVKMQLQDNREVAGRAIVIVKRPDQFRFEILGPFNQISIIVVYNGTSLSLLSFQENRVYKDYPIPIDVSRLPQYLVGLPSEQEAVNSSVALYEQRSFVGDKPKLYSQLAAPCLLNLDGEQILINNQGSIKEIVFSQSPQPLNPSTSQPSHPIQVSMDDYKEIDGFNFPFAISISNRSSSTFIKYEHIELNQHISDDLFNLPR